MSEGICLRKCLFRVCSYCHYHRSPFVFKQNIFFVCEVRVDPSISGNVASPSVCRSGILAHFPIRHKPLMHSTRTFFSRKAFEKDGTRTLGCIGSVAGRVGFSVSDCGDFRSYPTNDKPAAEGAPTNRPPCHMK